MSTRYQNRMGAERLDVLEPPLGKKGCNAFGCGKLVVYRRAGPFSTRRLCSEHARLYFVHDRIVERILALPNRDIL